MKTLRALLSSFAFAGACAYGLADTNTFPSTGNVGVGTTSPSVKLHVAGAGASVQIQPDANSSPALTLIGLNSQTYGGPVIYFLSSQNSGYPSAGIGLGALSFRNGAWGDAASIMAVSTQTHTSSASGAELRFSTTSNGSTSSSQRMVVTNDGNVGIGTTNPSHKLSVNGTIRAKEVIVDTGWSDYVFDPAYRLAPLSEVEQHIKTDGHLPGIPSASEVAEHGVSMGEMQSKLLAKIEELTLHQIEQEKRIERLEAENARLAANSIKHE